MSEASLGDEVLPGHSRSDLLALWHAQSEDHALFFLAPDTTVVAVNGAVARILGYAPEELVGGSLRRIFSEDDLANGIDVHEIEVATQLGRAEDDRWHIGKGGRRVWISGVMMCLRDAGGTPIGYAKLLRDRTDLRTEMTTLANQVAEGKAAATRKDDFLVTLGHELRNPLGSLTYACELLRTPVSEERRDRLIEIIDRQVGVVGRLVDDLRDAARADTGRFRLERRPLSLQGVLRATIELHRAAAEARSQRLHALFPEPDIVVSGDPVRLEQIVRNLLDNAIKYTPEGGAIAVTATVEGAMAVVRVQDEGIGLSAETMPSIFDLFTREDRAVLASAEGLGIGLALVKNLVALHDGIIQVQSAGPGQGSEFTVQLPLHAPPVVEPPVA